MSKQKEQVQSSESKFNTEFETKLKKQHGSLTKIVFSVNNENLTAYLRQPQIYELDAVMTAISQAPISAAVGLFKTCFVGGDEQLVTLSDSNTGLGVAISKQMEHVIPNVSSTSTQI